MDAVTDQAMARVTIKAIARKRHRRRSCNGHQDPLFEAGVPLTARRLLRIHQLGHVLSWEHVDTVPSVMSSTSVVEPTDFDRVASKIAFQRLPGKQSLDIDLSGVSLSRVREERRHSGSD